MGAVHRMEAVSLSCDVQLFQLDRPWNNHTQQLAGHTFIVRTQSWRYQISLDATLDCVL